MKILVENRGSAFFAIVVATGGLAGCSSGGDDTAVLANVTSTPDQTSNIVSAHRKFAFSSNGGQVNFVPRDRSADGGLAVAFNETTSGGSSSAAIPASASRLENGGTFEGLQSMPLSGRSTIQTAQAKGYTVENSTELRSLTLVDTSFARVGVYTRLDKVGLQLDTGAFYGASNPSTVNNAPAVSANYTGGAAGILVSDEGITTISGELNMRANIGAGSVSGQVSNITETLRNGSKVSAKYNVNMNAGAISGNSYAGNVAVVDKNTGAVLVDTSGANGRANYRGGFYGPNGEETAGMIDVTGTGADPQSGKVGRLDFTGIFFGER
jgi:hypothetical protein